MVTMSEVTDLMRVAQYVKSDKTAPSDVYNAACRMLDQPDEAQVAALRRELAETKRAVVTWKSTWNRVLNQFKRVEPELAEARATVESVRQYAAELRTYNSPAGIASVYADALDALLPPRDAESHGDGRTPQAVGATEEQEAEEAQEVAR